MFTSRGNDNFGSHCGFGAYLSCAISFRLTSHRQLQTRARRLVSGWKASVMSHYCTIKKRMKGQKTSVRRQSSSTIHFNLAFSLSDSVSSGCFKFQPFPGWHEAAAKPVASWVISWEERPQIPRSRAQKLKKLVRSINWTPSAAWRLLPPWWMLCTPTAATMYKSSTSFSRAFRPDGLVVKQMPPKGHNNTWHLRRQQIHKKNHWEKAEGFLRFWWKHKKRRVANLSWNEIDDLNAL